MWDTHTHTHIRNGILLNHKKEKPFAVCSNMDGLGGHQTKWNVRERQMLCDIHIWNLKLYNKLANIIKREADSQIQFSSVWVLCKGHRGSGDCQPSPVKRPNCSPGHVPSPLWAWRWGDTRWKGSLRLNEVTWAKSLGGAGQCPAVPSAVLAPSKVQDSRQVWLPLIHRPAVPAPSGADRGGAEFQAPGSEGTGRRHGWPYLVSAVPARQGTSPTVNLDAY